MSLRDLPKLLRDDPALLEVRGRTNALIAVPLFALMDRAKQR